MTSHSEMQELELLALREENRKLREAAELVRWLAQAVHTSHEGPIDRCNANTCLAAMTQLDVVH